MIAMLKRQDKFFSSAIKESYKQKLFCATVSYNAPIPFIIHY